MDSNFNFLKDNEIFKNFYDACIEAEKSILISPAITAITSRRALELAVKWLYSFDESLEIHYKHTLSSLINDTNFKAIIEPELFPLIKYIISLGNVAVHTNNNIKRVEAILSLHNLHQFVSWIDYCYGDYNAQPFNENILMQGEAKKISTDEIKKIYEKLSSKDEKLEEMRKENEKLRQAFTQKRQESYKNYNFKIDEISEVETKERYKDIQIILTSFMEPVFILLDPLVSRSHTLKNIMKNTKYFSESALISNLDKINKYVNSKNYIEVFRIYKEIISYRMLDNFICKIGKQYKLGAKLSIKHYYGTIYTSLNETFNINIYAEDNVYEKIINLIDMIIMQYDTLENAELLNIINNVNKNINKIVTGKS